MDSRLVLPSERRIKHLMAAAEINGEAPHAQASLSVDPGKRTLLGRVLGSLGMLGAAIALFVLRSSRPFLLSPTFTLILENAAMDTGLSGALRET